MASQALRPGFRCLTTSRITMTSLQRHATATIATAVRKLSTSKQPTTLSRPQRLPRATRPSPFGRSFLRLAHSVPRPSPAPPSKEPNTPKQPSYELTFTCVPCGTRSAHNISKQGYHYGSVLITCPSCRNRHVISDHLDIFGSRQVTIEELLRERGQLVKRGTLGETGDLEFWEDGSTTVRGERQGDGEGMDPRPQARASTDAKNAEEGEAGAGAGAEAEAPGSTFGKA